MSLPGHHRPFRRSTWTEQFRALLIKQYHVQKRATKSNIFLLGRIALLMVILYVAGLIGRLLSEVRVPDDPHPPVTGVRVAIPKPYSAVMPLVQASAVNASDLALLIQNFDGAGIFNTDGNPIMWPAFVDFSSKQEADAYLYSQYGSLASVPAGFIFQTLGSAPEDAGRGLSYTLYRNNTVGSLGSYLLGYCDGEDVPAGMASMHRSAMRLFASRDGVAQLNFSTGMKLLPSRARMTYFDFVPYVEPLFYTWMLMFLLPVFAEGIVYEKEHGLQNLLHCTGVKKSAYFAAQIVYQWVMYATAVAIIMLVGFVLQLQFFTRNSPGLYLVLFVEWGFCLCALSFLASSFFSSTRSCTVTLYFLVLLLGITADATVVSLANQPGTTEATMLGISVVPPFALFRALYDLSLGSSAGNPGLTLQTMDSDGYHLSDSYIFLAWETVAIALAFAYIESHQTLHLLLKQLWKTWRPVACVNSSSSNSNRKARRYVVPPNSGVVDGALHSAVPDPEVEHQIELVRELIAVSSGENFPGIIVDHVSKTFASHGRTVTAVDDVSFAIRNGQCYGLVGHNGAGKTTLLNMLSGSMKSSSGRITVEGLGVESNLETVRAMTGYCPQFSTLWDDMTGAEHLYLFGRLKGLRGEELRDEVDRTLRAAHLEDFRSTCAAGYSGGMRRKLSVQMAMVGHPQVVFLDEPSTGLDPHAKRELWDSILSAKQDKVLLLTTHSLEEAEVLCDQLVVIAHGQLKAIGHAEELKSRYSSFYLLSVAVQEERNMASLAEWILTQFQGARILDSISCSLKITLPEGTDLASIFRVMNACPVEYTMTDFGVGRTTLESVFVRLTGKEPRRGSFRNPGTH